MNSKQVTYIFLAFIAIFGWNAFLIQRDDALFKAHYQQQAIDKLKYRPSNTIK
jgi:hypothetical protein